MYICPSMVHPTLGKNKYILIFTIFISSLIIHQPTINPKCCIESVDALKYCNIKTSHASTLIGLYWYIAEVKTPKIKRTIIFWRSGGQVGTLRFTVTPMTKTIYQSPRKGRLIYISTALPPVRI
jgi:hypothetical protein